MADAIHGNTEVGATKQDLIAARVQRELKFAAKLSPFFTDVSQFAVKGAKSISFPRLGSFTAVDRASAVAGDATVITAAVDKLDLDKTPYVAWIIDSNDEVQSTLNFQVEAAGRAASAHGRRLDTDILAVLEADSEATTTAGAITYDITLEMRQKFLDQEGDMDKAVWIVGGDVETALLKISEFKSQDLYGPNGAIRAGVLGTLFGAPVVRHNGIGGANRYYLAGMEGLAYGFQRQPAMDDQPANQYGVGSRRWAMDQLYGLKALQIGEAGAAPGKSALLIKDNNI